MRSKILQALAPIIYFYRIIGVFPISNDLKLQPFSVLYSLILLIFSLLYSIYTIYSVLDFSKYVKHVNINFSVYLFFFSGFVQLVLSNTLCLINILLNSKKLIYFFKKLEDIDFKLLNIRNLIAFSKRVTILQLICISILIGILIFYFCISKMYPPLFGFIPILLPVMLPRLTEFCIEQLMVTCFLLVKQRFKAINMKLNRLLKEKEIFNFEKVLFHQNLQYKILKLRVLHSNLELLIKFLNSIFNLNFIVSLLTLFTYIIVFLYFSFKFTSESNTHFTNLPSFVLIFIQILYRTVFLIWACGSTSNEVSSFEWSKLVDVFFT